MDFDSIKYNLYEILNVNPKADEIKIKKSFIKLIKTFHPDKNSQLEEDIYHHLILSSQILLNKDTRKKYDEHLEGKIGNFCELRNNFSKEKDSFDLKSAPEFKLIEKELNDKHGYSTFTNKDSTREDITIKKEDIKDTKNFNEMFDTYTINGTFKDQLIEKPKNSEITTYTDKDTYTNLQDLDKLYIEDSILTPQYSSLDQAFKLLTMPK